MLCTTATELVRELKISKKWLPPYNENAIQTIVGEVNASMEYMKSHRPAPGAPPLPESVQLSTTAHLHSVRRQKRCVLAYLNYRVDKLRAVWWDTGAALPEELKAVLSPQEQTFLSGYDKLLTSYMTETDLVLTADQHPPKDLYVAVQAARGRSVGEIVTSTGSVVQLDDNSEVLVRRTDAELLIRQGQLVQVGRE